MTTIFKDINEVVAQRPSIAIDNFTKNYLPLVFHKDPTVFNIKWLREVAMHQHLEVNVLDNDGSVAYVVPALRPSHVSQSTTALNDMGTVAALESGTSGKKAQLYIQSKLPFLVTFDNSPCVDSSARWHAILTRHGYGDRLATLTTKSTSSTVSTVEPEQDEW